ncbi:MAG: bifunctional aspartate kinase/diaminopimelate decarboxylase [Gammaproteobacteria bacterium]
MTIVVLKFGGTSVATAQGWKTILDRIGRCVTDGETPIVVHSALAGVSNALERVLVSATRDEHHADIEQIAGQHAQLARDLGFDDTTLISAELTRLQKLSAGIALIGEASPRQRARVLALGERMASRLGYAFLSRETDVTWLDARELLHAVTDQTQDPTQHFLNASCDVAPDDDVRERFRTAPAFLTQGFIAADANGETVVLGRGGSDTTASYLAVLASAARVEIWTDVAGMYSADPRLVPGARLLKKLDYAEAQEIASTGARVLHPRCISPAQRNGIELHVRSTHAPDAPGTLICATPGSDDARLKAVSARKGITLLSMETSGMWQQPGFLARAFTLFAQHQLSIDLISTSETSVTVSLDAPIAARNDQLNALCAALGDFCRVSVVHRCAAISLVGRRVRAILHEVAPAFDVFKEFEIHLVSQAANDLNFTFVVDEDHSDKLVQRLHDLLIHRPQDDDPVMGAAFAKTRVARRDETPWWQVRRDELVALAPDNAPVYVYDRTTIARAAESLNALEAVDRLLYSSKANGHADVLRTLAGASADIECVSIGELDHIREALPDLASERLLFTPNFAPRDEYARALQHNVLLTVDNRFVLEQWGDLFAERDILLRVDPGDGQGHHKFVRTAGKQSKFGVPLNEVAATAKRASDVGARLIGLHAHKGSGIVDATTWAKTARTLAQAAATLSGVRVLNLGGGLGVPDTSRDPLLNLDALDQHLLDVKRDYPDFALWLEPGRFLVAAAGVLLTRVTQIKDKDGVRYVGVNTGMNSLIRPALYGAHHHIVNLSRPDQPADELVDVVGPICESADVLGKARMVSPCSEGDVLLIANVGAYGRTMASDYNQRPPGDEIVI